MIYVLKFIERLEKVGFTPDQAKETVGVWMEFLDQNFASKSDIRELNLKMDSKIDNLESKMTIKFGTMLAGAVGILISVMAYLK